jgi:hypothetical protein
VIEVHHLQVVELVKVGEEQIPMFKYSLLDCSVKSDDERAIALCT